MKAPVVMAIGAHPDDIEFMMAGTLLLLGRQGWEMHYLNVANGNCGSLVYGRAALARMRRRESQAACRILGAHYHPSLTNDLEIVYDLKLLRRLSAVIREVNPRVLLVHSPQDYMEDHTNACRLAVSAAFTREMPNFKTVPSRKTIAGLVTVYHAMPQGLHDPLRRLIIPGAFVNTESVQDLKRQALAAHASQKKWLDESQGMDSYLRVMDDYALTIGRWSRRFKFAEGWRRHLHYGFCGPDDDPLKEFLGRDCLVNQKYEQQLKKGV